MSRVILCVALFTAERGRHARRRGRETVWWATRGSFLPDWYVATISISSPKMCVGVGVYVNVIVIVSA